MKSLKTQHTQCCYHREEFRTKKPIDCVRFASYCGKTSIRHRFPYGELNNVRQATLWLLVESKLGIRGSTDRHKMQQKWWDLQVYQL